jgi:rhamnogalacturonan endolyase
MRNPFQIGKLLLLLRVAIVTGAACTASEAAVGAAGDETRAEELVAMGRSSEKLGRGLVAMKREDGSVYLGWRQFGIEPRNSVFEIFRTDADGKETKLGEARQTTDFTDASPPAGGKVSYHVIAVAPDGGRKPSGKFSLDLSAGVKDYISVPIPEAAKSFMTPAVADLDGDGKMDFIVKTPDSYLDPAGGSWHKDKRSYKMHAVTSDGTPLWMNDLGRSIEVGVWYSPYVAYDLNGDGKAEVAVKTGGTTNQPDAVPVTDKDGRVTGGEESVSIWDGVSGKELAKAPWPDKEGFESYNTYSRNLMGIAYLDGETPAVIVARGTYGIIKIDAYTFAAGKLTKLWSWKSTDEEAPGYHGDGSRDGAGSHFMHAADVDGDGKDEISYGSFVLDDNGKGLWCLKRTGQGKVSPGGHPDGTWVGDILPQHPGLEIFLTYEKWQEKNGACLVNAATGELIWGLDKKSGHFHRAGLCSDIDSRHPGMECFAKDYELKTGNVPHAWLWTADGKVLADKESHPGNRDLAERH